MQGETLTLAAVGDCQITVKLSPSQDPRFLELVEVLRRADVAYANMEQCIHALGSRCYPSISPGGTYTHSPPFVADEIQWMGIDVVSLATNHALDWMYGGLQETLHHLDRVGIPHAGTGMTLAEARAPCFVDATPGRVALIDVDTSKPIAAAADARRDAPGRPGLSPVKITRRVTLDRDAYASLQRIAETLRGLGIRRYRETPTPDVIDLGLTHRGWPVTFVPGDAPRVTSVPDARDVQAVVQMVRDAKRQADWVGVSQHHHVTDGADRDRPSKAVEAFAHTCLDAGADIYIGTGAHRIQGIEVYDGKPILYCLPDFIQTRDMGRAPPQPYYETYGLGFTHTPMDAMDARGMKVTAPPRGSGIVVCTFHQHRVADIKLIPVDPQADRPRWQMGRPRRADDAMSRQIVAHWAKLSAPYGTTIRYADGVGLVDLE